MPKIQLLIKKELWA